MHKQAFIMGIVNQCTRSCQHTILTIDHAIGVEVIGFPISIGVYNLGSLYHRLPRAYAIGIAGNFRQSGDSLKISIGARIATNAKVIGAGINIRIDKGSIISYVVGVKELNQRQIKPCIWHQG